MWCKKQRDDIMDVTFSDKSFTGPMCKADFMKALGMKIGPEPKPDPKPETPRVASAMPQNGAVAAAK